MRRGHSRPWITSCAPISTLRGSFRSATDFLLEASREDSPLAAEVRETFSSVASLVQAAQQAGELKSGDAEEITALIFGAAYGTSELSVSARERATAGPALDLAPLLLELLRETGSGHPAPSAGVRRESSRMRQT